MKSFFKDIYDSRLGKYLAYGILYVLFWKFVGFEIIVIIIGSTILGELDYQFKNRQ